MAKAPGHDVQVPQNGAPGPRARELVHGSHKLPRGFSSWMIKFASSSDPKDIGSIEYAYSLMAHAAGVDPVQFAPVLVEQMEHPDASIVDVDALPEKYLPFGTCGLKGDGEPFS